MPLSRREIRQRSAQILALLSSWDPMGVSPDWVRDEYECMTGPLLTLLQRGAELEMIASYLESELDHHFGVRLARDNVHAMAERILLWYERSWKDIRDPVTVFVRLPDKCPDAFRPVQARPLEGDMYRLIGVEADVSNERWEFPSGAIVRCVQAQTDGSECRLTAIRLEEAG
jgi:hypothetical protein